MITDTDTDSARVPQGSGEDTPPRSDKRATPIAASAATWAFAFLVFRVFAVSGYDWNTAFLVSTTLGLDDGVAIVFGSLMAEHLLVSALLVFLAPLLIAVCLWAPDGRRAVVILPTALGVAALIALTISFGRWWLPAGAIAVLVVFVLIQRLPASHRLRHAVSLVMARVGWISGIAVLLAAILTETPWVPLERIETVEGAITGYVLSVDSGYLNVLTEEHDFVIVISGDVLARE
mgnify:CR=1 FL=1